MTTIITRHGKPYSHLYWWHCRDCGQRGSWHSSQKLARHEADRHHCVPGKGGEAT